MTETVIRAACAEVRAEGPACAGGGGACAVGPPGSATVTQPSFDVVASPPSASPESFVTVTLVGGTVDGWHCHVPLDGFALARVAFQALRTASGEA